MGWVGAAVFRRIKPYAAMTFLQFGFAGLIILSVALLKNGMSHYVLVVYRNIAATIFISPFALYFERKVRPRMRLSTFAKIMLIALVETVLDQNLYFLGVKLTSGSFGAAIINMLPAITFMICIVLRIEKINLKTTSTRAKIVGTLITVVGALVMILYKGPILEFFWTKGRSHKIAENTQHGSSTFLKGTFILISACFCWSSFYILQSHTLKEYPAELSLTALICGVGVIETTAVTLVMERGRKPWAIGWDMRLLTIVYSGVMCSGVAYYLQGVVMRERGPVFATAFNPLCMIIVAILGSLILAEEISLGMTIGAIIIVIGLYFLIWGKSKEYETLLQNLPIISSPEKSKMQEFDAVEQEKP